MELVSPGLRFGQIGAMGVLWPFPMHGGIALGYFNAAEGGRNVMDEFSD